MLSATTWMDLETAIPGKVTKEKTGIIWYHLYVESKKGRSELIYKTEIELQK